MTRSDPDLAAVRAAAVDIAGRGAQPSPDAIARVWSRVAVGSQPAAKDRRFRWLAVPAGAVAVAAVLAATALLQPSPGPGQPVGSSPSQPLTTPSATQSPSWTPSVRVTDVGTVVGAVPVAQVIDTLVDRSASVVPVTPAEGQVLYLRIEAADVRTDGTVTTRLNEQWLDPNGLRALNIVLNGRDLSSPDPRDGSTFTPEPPGPPSLMAPTPQWLAQLTTDPVELYEMFAALNGGGQRGDDYVLKELSHFMRVCDPLLPLAQRAALFGVLGEINGLLVSEIDIAGWRLYGLHQPNNPIEELVDPGTGRVVGERWTDSLAGTESIELMYFALVDEVGQTG